MSRLNRAAASPEPGNGYSLPGSALPALYLPRVAGYARGPFLHAVAVTPTDWRWRNCRSYLVKDRDGMTYRAIRVTDARTNKFAGYWAVELLGDLLPPLEWEDETLALAVRVAKAHAGLDPDEKHVPALFIDYLPRSMQQTFWERHLAHFFDTVDPS